MRQLFELGQYVMTYGAMAATQEQGMLDVDIAQMLKRHASGDWGCVCDEDKHTNNEALAHGNRILSAYPIDPEKSCTGYGDNCIWIITEADRSVTTILLPEEY